MELGSFILSTGHLRIQPELPARVVPQTVPGSGSSHPDLTASPPGGLPSGLGIVVRAGRPGSTVLKPPPRRRVSAPFTAVPGAGANTGLTPRKQQGVGAEYGGGAGGEGQGLGRLPAQFPSAFPQRSS